MDRHHVCLLVAVFLDLFGVALVVPLLPSLFKELGGDPQLWGVTASIYSVAQIIGGVLLGSVSDRFGRRAGLLLSMAGAAVSYGIVGCAFSVGMLIVSRIIVGLVKQTMTLSTALAADISSDPAGRAEAVAQVAAAVSTGFMTGQAIGGTISDKFGVRSPAALSVAIFVLDFFWVRFTLPSISPSASKKPATRTGARASVANAAGLLVKRSVASVVVVRLLHQLVFETLRSMGNLYLEERFGLTPGELGRVGFFTGLLKLGVQGAGVGTLVRSFGETRIVVVMLLLQAVAAVIESMDISLTVYVWLLMPLKTVVEAVVVPCLSSMFVGAVPETERGAALGGFDVLNSVVGVAAPIVGGWAIVRFGARGWNGLGAVGYFCVAVLVTVLLSFGESGQLDKKSKQKQ